MPILLLILAVIGVKWALLWLGADAVDDTIDRLSERHDRYHY